MEAMSVDGGRCDRCRWSSSDVRLIVGTAGGAVLLVGQSRGEATFDVVDEEGVDAEAK